MTYLKREQFLWNYIKSGEFPECYKDLTIQNKPYGAKKNNDSLNLPAVTYVSLFPKFLTPKMVDFDTYALKTVHHYNFDGAGIYIDLDKKETIDSYMNEHFKRQLKVNIKRYINRLETSFNVRYEYNFGDITLDKYNSLMSTFKEMLIKRFEQKNIKNNFLTDWSENIKGIFDLINKSKASLFVIYDDVKPISISLNYHESKTIMFGHASSFDVDYSKFGLGHLDNYLLLDWCLKNNYRFLDLGTGISDYKEKWCNTFYDFEYHLYYKKKSILAILIVYFEIFKIKSKNFIKSIGFKSIVLKIKNALSTPQSNEPKSITEYDIETITNPKVYNNSTLNLLNINTTEYSFLRLPTYNYLYSNQENINDVSVYKIVNELKTYMIQGKNSTIKVIFSI